MAINYAVWHIFDSSSSVSYGNSPYWLVQAEHEAALGFPGVNFSQVGIYTPVNQYDPNLNDAQEFLSHSLRSRAPCCYWDRDLSVC